MLKSATIGILLIALCALILWDSSSFPACVEHHKEATAEHTLQNKVSVFGSTFSGYRDCVFAIVHENRDDLLTIFTIVLAFSTIMLWVATRALANDAAESSRLELRAYIDAKHPRFGKPDPDSIAIQVENGGRTPAYKVNAWINTQWIKGQHSVLPDGFKYLDNEPSKDFNIYRSVAMLHPGGKAEFSFPFQTQLIKRVRRTEIALFLYGHVDYFDIFDKSHTTTFCYQYFPAEVGIGHRLVMYDEHNDAT